MDKYFIGGLIATIIFVTIKGIIDLINIMKPWRFGSPRPKPKCKSRKGLK